MSRARLGTALAAAALLVGAAVVGGAALPDDRAPSAAADAGATSVEPRLVLVSGRDDHGMVVADQVPLYDAPQGTRKVAVVPDGTLVEVLETDGQWLEVRAVEGQDATGWVDDFFLRGEARLVGAPPSCAVRLGGDVRDGGTLVVVRRFEAGRVLVETVTPPAVRAWARRADLQELPPQGRRCGDVPPGDRHAHADSHSHSH